MVTPGEIGALANRNHWGGIKRATLRLRLDNLVTIDLNDDALLDAYLEIEGAARAAPGGARNPGHNDLELLLSHGPPTQC